MLGHPLHAVRECDGRRLGPMLEGVQPAMTAEEIRALYTETLARSRYARGRGLDGSPWGESSWRDTYLEGASKDVDALAEAGLLPPAESPDVAFELTRTADRLMRLAEDVRRGNAEHVTKVDRLHTEIEAAHRRWWHPLFGIRWEMTGWSRKGSGWQL